MRYRLLFGVWYGSVYHAVYRYPVTAAFCFTFFSPANDDVPRVGIPLNIYGRLSIVRFGILTAHDTPISKSITRINCCFTHWCFFFGKLRQACFGNVFAVSQPFDCACGKFLGQSGYRQRGYQYQHGHYQANDSLSHILLLLRLFSFLT